MGKHLHGPVVLSIPNGGTDTPVYNVQSALGAISSMIVFAPAALTGVISIQVAPIDTPGAAPNDLKTLQWQPGTDVAIAAGKAVNIPLTAGFRSFRIHSASAEGAQRDFPVTFQLDVDATE